MMTNSFKINGRKISHKHASYIIAEMSANHNGNIETAFKLIDAAKEAGADAVKMQTYTPETITLKSEKNEFIIKGGIWNGRTLYDLYEEAIHLGNGTNPCLSLPPRKE